MGEEAEMIFFASDITTIIACVSCPEQRHCECNEASEGSLTSSSGNSIEHIAKGNKVILRIYKFHRAVVDCRAIHCSIIDIK